MHRFLFCLCYSCLRVEVSIVECRMCVIYVLTASFFVSGGVLLLQYTGLCSVYVRWSYPYGSA